MGPTSLICSILLDLSIMTWTTLGLYIVTATVMAIIPGPAVLLVIAQGLQGGFRKGLWGSLGILSVNTIFFILSAVGLTAMMTASYELFTVVKWVGAAYLVVLGLQTFFGKGSMALSADIHATQGPPVLPKGWRWRTYVRGILLQASNPKAILFFTALVPQFINPGKNLMGQMAILGGARAAGAHHL